MSFSGPDPYGTAGGNDNINLPQTPEDIRVAETRMLVLFLHVNGPVVIRNRENLEDVIRILDFDRFPQTIIVRSNGIVIDNAAGDVDFNEGLLASIVTPGLITVEVSDILTDMIPDGILTLAKLASGSVDSSKIIDGSIVNADIHAAAAIAGSKLADGAITTVKIVDANVTLAKLASGSVDSSKIIDGSIVNADINAAAEIDFSKLSGVASSSHTHTPVIQTVTGSDTGSATVTATATCPGGTTIVGCGYTIGDDDEEVHSFIISGNSCIVEYFGFASVTLTAYAKCLTTPIG